MMTSMRNRLPADLPLKELPVSALLADSIWREAKSDVALIPAATFAANVASDSQTAVPLQDDSIVIVELTGVQLQNALIRSISYVPKLFAGLLSTAGMTAMVVLGPDGRAKLSSIDVGGKRLDLTKRYRVAMPKPLADGQLGYFQIWDKQTPRSATNLTVLGCNRKQLSGAIAAPSYKIVGQ